MTGILELSVFQATIIAIALPIVALGVFVLIIHWLRNGSGSRVRRYLSYLVNPPRIGSLKSNDSEVDANHKHVSLWRELKVRLFFVYLGIAIFLVSFMIGEFYEVIFDLLLPVTQGSTGDIRTVSSVVFQSPFNAGWIGAMPWYGSLPAPSDLGTYHETWSWVFMTAAYTDNPYFLETMITALLVISFLVGLVFLAPLGSKTIRRSLVSSMFFFMTGMTIFTKTVFGCFAQAWALVFGEASIYYGILSVTGDMIPNLIDALSYGFPIILAMFAFFMVLGRKLWKTHYNDSESRTWFLVYITMSYWMGLALTILVA
ncbi:MAG: hypothetical protein ACXADF_14285 [Candidatus Thorarchaeota archaeon]|jgi:hypothetical protein